MSGLAVSIIIPVYNRAALLGETLQSIQAQTFQDWECIIVDDGSTDETLEIANQFARNDKRFFVYTRPAGLAKGANSCRNIGLDRAQGEFIALFDSDDIMLPHKLQTQLNLIRHTNSDYCVGRYVNFDASGTQSEPPMYRHNKNYAPSLENFATGRFFWGTIDFMGRRSAIGQRRFHPGLRANQEYHFFIAFLTTPGLRACYTEEVLALRRMHSESIQAHNRADSRIQALNKYRVYAAVFSDFGAHFSPQLLKFTLNRLGTFYYRKRVVDRDIGFARPFFFRALTREVGVIKAWAYRLVCSAAFMDSSKFRGHQLIKKFLPKLM